MILLFTVVSILGTIAVLAYTIYCYDELAPRSPLAGQAHTESDPQREVNYTMNIEQFNQFIVKIFKDLKVDTVTIYTPDPWSPDKHYRLLRMSGVEDDGPMYGLEHPRKGVDRLLQYPDRNLPIRNVDDNALFRDSPFARRERIKSLIRFHLLTEPPHSDKSPGAILFLSYRHDQHFEVDYLGRLEVAVTAIEALLSQLGAEAIVDTGTLAKQTAWLPQIAQATRDIMVAKDVDNVIEKVLRCALATTEVGEEGYCCIHLKQPDGKRIGCSYRVWPGGKFDARPDNLLDIKTGKGITTKVAAIEKPLLFRDFQEACDRWPERYSYILYPLREPLKMKAELAVPMYAMRQLIGVLNIESPKSEAFRPEHVPIMEMLADTAAVAIVQSMFNKRLNRILESVAIIDPDPAKVIEQIKNQAAIQMLADDSKLHRYDGNNFFNPADPHAEPRPRQDGYSKWLLTEGQKREPPVKALLFTEMDHLSGTANKKIITKKDDVMNMERCPVEIPLNPQKDPSVRTEACLPLIFRNKPLGVLWVRWLLQHEFTDEEVLLLDTFANQASIAYHIADIMHEPLTATYESALRSGLGVQRATYFARRPELLKPKYMQSVTAMFADIRGSTKVMEVLRGSSEGQELYVEIIRDFYKNATRIVHEHEGTLASFLGDGVMALFGAPATGTKEVNDAEQAALAALKLAEYFQSNLRDWETQISESSGGRSLPPDFGLGIGLHRDWALVGTIAEEGAFDYTAIGRAPTIAARIQDLARGEELEKASLWPDDGATMGRTIVLCTAFMENRFSADSGIVTIRSKGDVHLKGVDGEFCLAVLRHGRTQKVDK